MLPYKKEILVFNCSQELKKANKDKCPCFLFNYRFTLLPSSGYIVIERLIMKGADKNEKNV